MERDEEWQLILGKKDVRIAALEHELGDALNKVKRLEGLACLICGRDEPCELSRDTGEANWPGSPCTFDPSPVNAAMRFMAERDELTKQLAKMQRDKEVFGRVAADDFVIGMRLDAENVVLKRELADALRLGKGLEETAGMLLADIEHRELEEVLGARTLHQACGDVRVALADWYERFSKKGK